MVGSALAQPAAIGLNDARSSRAADYTSAMSYSVYNNAIQAVMPGNDLCVKAMAAIAQLPSAGGTVDLREFAQTQPTAVQCPETLTIDKPVKLLMPFGTVTFNGSPGIKVVSSGVTIECQGAQAYTSPTTSATVLKSGVAAPLIAVLSGKLHSADGFAIRNCDLNGNGKGTFGIFAPESYTSRIAGVIAHDFVAAGILDLAGQADISNTIASNNRGDGFVLGYDGQVSGMSQSDGNSGDGWHEVAGGYVHEGNTCYRNGLHGIHVDGTLGGDWHGNATYTEQTMIQPTANNAGRYAFYSYPPGAATSSSRPSFCQSLGCTTADGAVTWINIGTANIYGFGVGTLFAPLSNVHMIHMNCSASNYGKHQGDWDNIRVDGLSNRFTLQNELSGMQVAQSELPGNPAHGIHLDYASLTSIHQTMWYGGAYTGGGYTADLGGVEIQNSFRTNLSDLTCFNSYGNCLALVHSVGTSIVQVTAINGGNGHAPAASTYALAVDAESDALVEQLYVGDDRGTPYQRGVFNAGSNNLSVPNRRYVKLATPPDSGKFSCMQLAPYGVAFKDLPTVCSDSSMQWCTDCNATCTAGNSTGRMCFREDGRWTH